jgi:cation transport ATPase
MRDPYMQLQAVIALEDLPHPGAKKALLTLQSMGLEIHILTGDSERPALHLAASLSVPRENVKVCRAKIF